MEDDTVEEKSRIPRRLDVYCNRCGRHHRETLYSIQETASRPKCLGCGGSLVQLPELPGDVKPFIQKETRRTRGNRLRGRRRG